MLVVKESRASGQMAITTVTSGDVVSTNPQEPLPQHTLSQLRTRKKLKRAVQEAEEALALQASVTHVAEESAPQPCRPPVARMW
jgi:hypothetical protein